MVAPPRGPRRSPSRPALPEPPSVSESKRPPAGDGTGPALIRVKPPRPRHRPQRSGPPTATLPQPTDPEQCAHRKPLHRFSGHGQRPGRPPSRRGPRAPACLSGGKPFLRSVGRARRRRPAPPCAAEPSGAWPRHGPRWPARRGPAPSQVSRDGEEQRPGRTDGLRLAGGGPLEPPAFAGWWAGGGMPPDGVERVRGAGGGCGGSREGVGRRSSSGSLQGPPRL